jgi:cell division protein FtsL
MTRLNVLLLLAVMTAAMLLVHSQYESRRLFMALEAANKEAHRLEVENDRLQVERRAQATPLRVEQIARQQLHMKTATPAITQYVSLSGRLLEPVSGPANVPAAEVRP